MLLVTFVRDFDIETIDGNIDIPAQFVYNIVLIQSVPFVVYLYTLVEFEDGEICCREVCIFFVKGCKKGGV